MYLEVLKSKQKEIFFKLKNFPEFYLTGGTALALQIKHRISADFDLFWKKDIPKSLLPKVKRVFKKFEVDTIINHLEQLSVRIDGVKIDFVKYRFPLILKLIKFEGIKILPIREIAASKAYVLNFRGTFKDYVDLYFVLKYKYSSLKEIKKIAEKKYKNEFNFRLFLEQLVYLEDIKEEKIEFLREKVSKPEMQEFFREEIQKLSI
ncbi:nucleotidyl transferase AbiEii/AbiGii toxin family protein [bacterium]|nr:nucleotidyl transferase AbiEii/AbiGii toxin family protein [bacterium]